MTTDYKALQKSVIELQTIVAEHERFKKALLIISHPMPAIMSPHDIALYALKDWPFPDLANAIQKPKPCHICGDPDCKKD